MPHRLKYRQTKIQEKRKETPWREFVMEICSWMPLNLYSTDLGISRYPDTKRIGKLTKGNLEEGNDLITNDIFQGNFMHDFSVLRFNSNKVLTTKDIARDNATFADGIYGASNVYLSFSVGDECKNVMYSRFVMSGCENIFESCNIVNFCENIFGCLGVTGSSNVFYSQYIANSRDIRFSFDLIGCVECIACQGLISKSYCVNNIQLSKEEYYQQKERILKNKLNKKSKLMNERKGMTSIHSSKNVLGNGIVESYTIENGFLVNKTQNSRNIIMTNGVQDIYDGLDVGLNTHDIYAVAGAGDGSSHKYCVVRCGKCFNIYYSYHLVNCSYCLGCIGLKNKSYCIFNKQYTKEDRYEKVDEIFTEMEKDGTLGNFFPGSMNPFYFNDTAAYLIDDSFTKEEVEAKGYLRRDDAITVDIPEGVQTVRVEELGEYEGRLVDGVFTPVGTSRDPTATPLDDDATWTIDPEIMKKVIVDEAGNAYRVIPMEYEFLMKHRLPLPRKHWLERIKQHFSI